MDLTSLNEHPPHTLIYRCKAELWRRLPTNLPTQCTCTCLWLMRASRLREVARFTLKLVSRFAFKSTYAQHSTFQFLFISFICETNFNVTFTKTKRSWNKALWLGNIQFKVWKYNWITFEAIYKQSLRQARVLPLHFLKKIPSLNRIIWASNWAQHEHAHGHGDKCQRANIV